MTGGGPVSAVRADDERFALVSLLTTHRPADADQARTRIEMIEFALAHPDALHRSCVPGHFTGSALVVEEGTGRFAVLFHRKLRKWLQPGGHCDGEPDVGRTALREAAEETGIASLSLRPGIVDLDIHEVRPPGEPVHRHLDVRFVVLAATGSELRGNHESDSLRWVRPGELDGLDADASLRRLVIRGLDAVSAS